VGIAGNQTIRVGGILRSLDLPADEITTSDGWGCLRRRKPMSDLVNRRRTTLLGTGVGVLVTGSTVSCSHEPSSRGEREFMVGDVTRGRNRRCYRDDAVDAGEREDPPHPRGGSQ
jgi:hypothetical protein